MGGVEVVVVVVVVTVVVVAKYVAIIFNSVFDVGVVIVFDANVVYFVVVISATSTEHDEFEIECLL